MIRRLSCFALSVCLAGCVHPHGSGPRGEGLLDVVALDERGPSPGMIERWAIVAEEGAHDERLALFAIERLGELVAQGISDEAAGQALARLDKVRLPPEARRRLSLLRARLARLRGDDAAAASLERDAGCGLSWRAGGMVGRLPRLDVVRDPEAALRETRSTYTRGCRVVALSPDGRAAALPIALDFSLERAGDVEIVVGADAPYQLWANGRPGPAPDGAASQRRVRRYRVSLPAGHGRFVITAAAVYGRLEVDVAVTATGLGFRAAPVGTPATSATLVEREPTRCPAHAPLEALYLEAADAQREGDGARARVAVERLLARSPKLAVGLALGARIAADDQTIPGRLGRDRARRLYERAVEHDPTLAVVRAELARLALARDRSREALDLAEAAPDRRALPVALLLADVLRARNRDAEVRTTLDAVPHTFDAACRLVEARATDARARHEPTALDPAQRLARCRPGSTTLAEAQRQRGALVEAIAELRRDVAADPLSEGARSMLGEALQQAGKLAEAADAYRALVALAPRAATYRLHLVDVLSGADRAADATRVLGEGVALDPENGELAAAARSLGHTIDRGIASDRIDGRARIEEFERTGRRYDSPAVFVLDRTFSRVYGNGAQRTITHDIIKVLSKEGIDRWGEWHLPVNAEVLTLCAWKPDGTQKEPEELAEKESISIPGLAAGDYVEVEYVERTPAPAAFRDGFLAERFYFASAEAPLARSEYTIVAPTAMPVEMDVRGAAPQVKVSASDGLTTRRFVVEDVAQRFPEPAAVPSAEFLPSVRLSAHVSRDAWRDYLTDLSWGSRRRDPVTRSLAEQLTRGDKDDRHKLLHLDEWVRRNIHGSGGLEDAATAILARREGNRATVLAALAESVGLPARMLLARSSRSAAIEDELEGFDQALLDVGGTIIDGRFRHAQPGELAAPLRGATALVLAPGQPPPVKLPVASTDRREMKVTIALRPDGGGKVSVEEHLYGWPALEWRESLERLPADRVRPQFEQRTLGYFFAGGVLEDLAWDNADRDDQPFVVRYSLDAPAVARWQDHALVMAAPFAAQLLRRFVTGAPRTTPAFVDEVAPTSLSLTVTLPPGSRVELAPAAAADGPHGHFEQRTSQTGDRIEMHSSFAMPTQRVSLADWARFVAFLVTVDRAEAAIATIRPPTAAVTTVPSSAASGATFSVEVTPRESHVVRSADESSTAQSRRVSGVADLVFNLTMVNRTGADLKINPMSDIRTTDIDCDDGLIDWKRTLPGLHRKFPRAIVLGNGTSVSRPIGGIDTALTSAGLSTKSCVLSFVVSGRTSDEQRTFSATSNAVRVLFDD